jgi:hypothetical protein
VAGGLPLNRLEISQERPRARQKSEAGLGWVHASRGAIEKLNAEPLFQAGDYARNGRGRGVKMRGCFGKAAAIGNRNEGLKLAKPVHSLFHYLQ